MTAARGETIRALIDRRAAETPDGVFFTSPESGRRVSWRELRRAAAAVGGALRRGNIAAGEIAGFMLGNGWAAAQMLLGITYNGRVVLPLNLVAGDAALTHALRESGCRLIFADEQNLGRLRRLADAAGLTLHTRLINIDEGIAGGDDDAEDIAVAGDTNALLMYTSGTTGMPKGVVHTHASLLAGGGNVAAAHEISAGDRALCVLPLYHINGECVTVFAPLVSGGGVVMPHRFRTGDFWRVVAEYECTWFSVVPTHIAYLMQNAEAPPPLPRLRFGRSASSPLPPSLQRDFEKRFGVPIIETMGLTETAAQILANPLPPRPRKSGSPGIAFGNEVTVLDTAGAILPPGKTGEIAVRGANVMRGYYRNAEKTAEAFAKDGWLLTGDLGHYDEDGYFFVTGRRKELIIKGGENIAPREIDEALLAVAGVVEAAAFARPCDSYGQRVEACVVVDGGGEGETTADALIAHCRKTIGAFKSPDKIHFLPELPKGPSGKVQRLKLAGMLPPE